MTKTQEFELGKGSTHVLPKGTIRAPIRESRKARESKNVQTKDVPALLKKDVKDVKEVKDVKDVKEAKPALTQPPKKQEGFSKK